MTGGTGSTDWTLSGNYLSAPVFSTANDLSFATITGAVGGVTLSAGTAGSYDAKDLYFGELTAAGSGQMTPQTITLNGNGTAGATTLNLAGNLYVPSYSTSKVILGSDLTLNLSDAVHSIFFQLNSNVTAAQPTLPVLVVNSLITGGGASAAFTPRVSNYGAIPGSPPTALSGTPAMVLTNNNNSFVSAQGSLVRYDGYVGFTSIANVGGGNSSLGNATTVASGLISLGNGGNLNYLGTGNQTSDRNIAVAGGTIFLGNASTGTTLTLNGALSYYGSGVNVRANTITGSTLVLNSNLGDGSNATSITKFGASTYYTTTGATATNDGGGVLVLGGNNTFTGAVAVNGGTLRTNSSTALGSTVGGTSVLAGATLDLSGQTIGAEAVSLNGVGVGSAGALLNSSASAASLSGAVTLATNSSVGATGDLTLSGVISESGGTARNLTKVGTGQLILGGANTYTGSTTVSAGTLVINGSTSTGAVTVATGATLAGGGTIGGAVTVNGNLKPGQGPGLLTTGSSLFMSSTATTTMDINGAARGVTFDAVNVGGLLTQDGSLVLNLGTTFSAGTYSFDLFDSGSVVTGFDAITLAGNYSGSLVNGGGGNWSLASGSTSWSFSENTGVLGLSVVPEPGVVGLLVSGLLVTVTLRRRKQA